jgi:hypothetical protein
LRVNLVLTSRHGSLLPDLIVDRSFLPGRRQIGSDQSKNWPRRGFR